MIKILFNNITELDTAYLNEAYANDAETAALVFEQYLQELPSNLKQLKETIKGNDIAGFRQNIHKQKPSFSYVGLTDVTKKLHELQVKCVVLEDLSLYKTEIDEVLRRIYSSAGLIEKALVHLKNINQA
jgi:HPt (histidine-containing phosphotransfer) domain-containing protein